MNTHQRPRLHLMQESQLGEDSWHSLLISLLRGLAALQVAAAHLRAEFFPGMRSLPDPSLWYQALAFFTGFAHQAVVVFFLISGWLVGGSFLNKMGKPDALRLYAIDRVTRLWTVLIPTFALIIAFGIVTGMIEPRGVDFSVSNAYSVASLAGNLTGMQTILVPPFGDNYPLWSLANESWYYLMFPLLVLSFTSRSRAVPALALLACTLLLPFILVLYFSIWLMGAAFSRVRIECGAFTRWTLAIILGALSVYFRITGNNDDQTLDSFGPDLLMSVVFMLLLSTTIVMPSASSKVAAPLRKLATLLSNFSFTLYVVHLPVLSMLRWLGIHLFGRVGLRPDHLGDLGLYFIMLAIMVGFAYCFYRLFEARTYQLRRALKRLLEAGKPVRAAALKL